MPYNSQKQQGIPSPATAAPEVPEYKFNRQTGFPEEAKGMIGKYLTGLSGKPLRISQHTKDRAGQKGINMAAIPNFNGTFPKGAGADGKPTGWGLHEINVAPNQRGDIMTKGLLRGPYDEQNDVIMPITHEGTVKSIWANNKSDNRSAARPLNANRFHYPEEYLAGHAPSRQLHEDNSQFVPHTDESFKAQVLAEHGAEARRARMAVKANEGMIDFVKLAELLGL